MTVVAHHAGEDSLAQALVLLGGGGLSVLLTIGRARLATARDQLMRIIRGG